MQKKHGTSLLDMRGTVRRFPAGAAMILLMAVSMAIATTQSALVATEAWSLWFSLLLGGFSGLCMTVLCTLWTEKTGRGGRLLAWLPCILWAGAAMLLTKGATDHAGHVVMILDGALMLLCLFLIAGREAPEDRLTLLLRGFLIAFGITLAAYAGLMVCWSAVSSLFGQSAWTSSAAFRVEGLVSALCWCGLAEWLFLCGIPAPAAREAVKGRQLMAVAFVPLFLLLTGILDVYAVVIALQGTMPVGQFNGFGLGALGAYTMLRLVLNGEENSLSRVFTRFGALLLLPIVAAQAVGVAIRLNAYGLTTARYVGLWLTALGIAAAVLSTLRKPVRWVLCVAAAVLMVCSAGPLSFTGLPERNQLARLTEALVRNDMLEDGRIVPAAEPSAVTREDRETIYGACLYLSEERSDTPIRQQVWAARRTPEGLTGLLGFSTTRSITYVSLGGYNSAAQGTKIAGFSAVAYTNYLRAEKADDGWSVAAEVFGRTYTFPLDDYLSGLDITQDSDSVTGDIRGLGGMTLRPTHLSIGRSSDGIESVMLYGWVMKP